MGAGETSIGVVSLGGNVSGPLLPQALSSRTVATVMMVDAIVSLNSMRMGQVLDKIKY